jgi:hypothetical protein
MRFQCPDLEEVGETKWTKSSLSGGSGCCVEVAIHDEVVLVRDSKYRRSGKDPRAEPVIVLSHPQWAGFLDDVVGKTGAGGSGFSMTPEPDGTVKVTSMEDQTSLAFTASEWSAFVRGVELGEFDARTLVATNR